MVSEQRVLDTPPQKMLLSLAKALKGWSHGNKPSVGEARAAPAKRAVLHKLRPAVSPAESAPRFDAVGPSRCAAQVVGSRSDNAACLLGGLVAVLRESHTHGLLSAPSERGSTFVQQCSPAVR